MSLTSFLQIKQVKEIFAHTFPVNKVELESVMVAPPITNHYSLMGTAFDYLFRFYLEYKNPQCITTPWVAENAVNLIEKYVEKNVIDINHENIGDTANMMRLYLDKAKHKHTKFISNGKIDDEICKTAITLARMDIFYRANKLPTNLNEIDSGDIEDLHALISNVDYKKFKAKNHCYLNPTFGNASVMIGGADADLIIDEMLIDIKTTKNLKLTQNYWNQLIGYYILSKIGINLKISNLAIYFSRHGVLHTVPISKIENSDFDKFVRWFEKSVKMVFKPK